MKKLFEPNAEYQPRNFAFKNQSAVEEIIARYPLGKERSAVMPLLDLAQRQIGAEGFDASPPYGGWIPRVAMDEIARIINVPPIKVYEVASFYSMYNLAPVGKFLVQLCTTTPCMLCNAGEIVKACEEHLGIHIGETTNDMLFTLMEVECLGACVNAPMVQINDDYFEDLTADSMKTLLVDLALGRTPKVGSQKGRKGSMALTGATSLTEQTKAAGA